MSGLNFIYNSCAEFYATTPDNPDTFLQFVRGSLTKDFTNIRNYSIDYSVNCCTPTRVLLPVRYNFLTTITNCSVSGAPPNNVEYTFNVTGINYSFVKEIVISFDNSVFTPLVHSNIGNGFSFVLNYVIPTSFPTNIFLRIVHQDSFQYDLAITLSTTGTPCDTALSTTITYPSLPQGVVIDTNNRLNLVTLFTTIHPSVYQVIICENSFNNTTSSRCVQDFYFAECDIKCSIVNKLVQCRDSDIMMFYDALRYSNDCDNLRYTDVCSIYELFYNKLTQPGCYDPFKNCNCNDTLAHPVNNRQINSGRTYNKGCTHCGS